MTENMKGTKTVSREVVWIIPTTLPTVLLAWPDGA